MSSRAQQAWRRTQLGELATKLVNGGTPPTEVERFWKGATPWVTGADFTDSGIGMFRRFVSEEAIMTTATNVIERGQVLIVTRTGVGKVAIAPCNIAISQDITGLYVDASQVLPAFLYQWLRNGIENLKRLNQGTSINGIVRGDLVNLSLDLPTIPEQRSIAEILSTLDEVIERTEALIAKHRQIKAGLMHDLFTRGVTVDGRLRSTSATAPRLYKESPLGWIPEEWDAVPSEQLCRLITKGTTPIESRWLESSSSIPFLRVQNLSFDGRLGFDEDRTYVPSAVARGELARSRVFPGDVLMNIVGPPLGKVSVVPEEFPECNINQAIAIFRPLKVEFGPYLRWYLLSSIATQWFLRRAKRTSGQVNITLEMCSQLPVPYPRDGAEMRKITDRLDAIQGRIESEEDHRHKLGILKSGLMDDLLTGRVRVNMHEVTA